MKTEDHSKYNAEAVLEKLEHYIEAGCARAMVVVCDDLSIFDWWTDMLSVAKMKQMRSFLKEAIKLGYTGYVCFKVGASGCANGMWAHKVPTTNGYSPESDFIYRSFTPDYTNWEARIGDKHVPECLGQKWDSCTTIKEFEAALQQAGC